MNTDKIMPLWCVCTVFVVPCIYFGPILFGWYTQPENTVILGGPVSDVWNGLWSWNWIVHALTQGENPLCQTNINYPKGGCLWPADILGSLAMLVLLPLVELPTAYTLWMYIQSVLLGFAGYLFYQEIGGYFIRTIEQYQENTQQEKDGENADVVHLQGMFVALFLQTGTFLRCALHNGTTEAWSLGWIIFACYGWLRVHRGYNTGWFWIFVVIFSSWYGVFAFSLFWTVHGVFVWCVDTSVIETRKSILNSTKYMLAIYTVWAVYALWVLGITETSSDMVAIKQVNDMAMVRRTIGSADIVGYIVPWKYDSPDFAEMSRFGEQFVHSTYIGIGVLCGIGFYRRKIVANFSAISWCVWFGVVGLLLSLGPVLVYQGQPVLLANKGIPMPYILLEKLPLFSHLTLLYRLGWIPGFVLAIVLAFHVGSKRGLVVCMVLMVLDNCFLSPVRELPYIIEMPVAQGDMFKKLADMPEGAVMHYPLVGGREFLFLQTMHHKPVAGILNFPLNAASRKVYNAIEKYASVQNPTTTNSLGMDTGESVQYPAKVIQEKVSLVAKQQGIRYIIVDMDPNIMPDQYYISMRKVREIFDLDNKVMAISGSRFQIIQLW